MAKTFNKEKHFDLNFFRAKGMAYFDMLDFSDISNEEIREIATCDIPEIEFYGCTFKDLDLSHTEFKSKITFSECQFNGNTNFSATHFYKRASFAHSVFNGIAHFDNVLYKEELYFLKIRTKPAKGGYFYFRGEEDTGYCLYEDHSITFSGAMFETEVSFLNAIFNGNTDFSEATFQNKFWFTNTYFGLKTNIEVNFECDGMKDIDICYRILKDALMRHNYTLQSREIELLEDKIRQKQRKIKNKEEVKPELNKPSDLLTTEEAAEYLKLKPNTLERWRVQHPDRLPFVKIGRTVKYRKEDLQAFITNNRRGE